MFPYLHTTHLPPLYGEHLFSENFRSHSDKPAMYTDKVKSRVKKLVARTSFQSREHHIPSTYLEDVAQLFDPINYVGGDHMHLSSFQ